MYFPALVKTKRDETEVKKREKKKRKRKIGSRWSREKDHVNKEEPREGVTTAALSITIFTTRRHLRDLNILCAKPRPVLAQLPGPYNYVPRMGQDRCASSREDPRRGSNVFDSRRTPREENSASTFANRVLIDSRYSDVSHSMIIPL